MTFGPMRRGGRRSRSPLVVRPSRLRWRRWRWAAMALLLLAALAMLDRLRDGRIAPRPEPAGIAGRPGAVFTGLARVVDGDTIELAGRRVRLFGIDAPEYDQVCDRDGQPWACGAAATEALSRHLAGRTVTCREVEIDRHGRSVARCFAGGEEINAWAVREGWAVAYRRYSDLYAAAEAEARAARRGLWSGRFELPEVHRHGEAER